MLYVEMEQEMRAKEKRKASKFRKWVVMRHLVKLYTGPTKTIECVKVYNHPVL